MVSTFSCSSFFLRDFFPVAFQSSSSCCVCVKPWVEMRIAHKGTEKNPRIVRDHWCKFSCRFQCNISSLGSRLLYRFLHVWSVQSRHEGPLSRISRSKRAEEIWLAVEQPLEPLLKRKTRGKQDLRQILSNEGQHFEGGYSLNLSLVTGKSFGKLHLTTTTTLALRR